MAKKIGWKLAFVAVVVGLAFSTVGCATLFAMLGLPTYERVENAETKKLLDAANDILIAKDEGMKVDLFALAFERKISGLEVTGYGKYSCTIKYKNRNFEMDLYEMDHQQGDKIYYYYTSATKCVEVIKKENKK